MNVAFVLIYVRELFCECDEIHANLKFIRMYVISDSPLSSTSYIYKELSFLIFIKKMGK